LGFIFLFSSLSFQNIGAAATREPNPREYRPLRPEMRRIPPEWKHLRATSSLNTHNQRHV
jgi:hypothetical protein